MTIPVQITFRHMDASPALEARIRRLCARLEHFSAHVLQCRVVIDAPHQRLHQGMLFDFAIDIEVPDRTITIRSAHPLDQAHENPYVALRDAFRAARRKLQEYERIRRGDVKQHAGTSPRRASHLGDGEAL